MLLKLLSWCLGCKMNGGVLLVILLIYSRQTKYQISAICFIKEMTPQIEHAVFIERWDLQY